MQSHKVKKKLELIGEFKSCKDCGRVHWLWAGPGLNRKMFPLAPEFVTEIEK
jgi:hypothetical protein